MAVSYRFDDNGNELLPEPKSVTWVNEYIKSILEEEVQLQDVYLSAEISNFKFHATGHMYFTLKDENSEIRAVMFRSCASRVKFKPENGMKVLVHARIGVYEKAGAYQLYVDSMQPDGIGSLYLAFEQLKTRLGNEGLFDAEHKKTIPKFPNKIGIVTSPTGAAIRDIIKVSKKRCPFVNLILFPASVQGEYAVDELIRGVEYLNATDSVDLIIIGRGGGSMEDLWCFNDEKLARAIYSSRIPVISAVGHEIDFTICDFVADVRAATPSHAAEIATPDVDDLKNRVEVSFKSLYSTLWTKIDGYKNDLENIQRSKVFKNPEKLFDVKEMQLLTIVENLSGTMISKIKDLRLDVVKESASLNALSPLSVFSRGYGAVFGAQNNVIKSINEVFEDDKISIKVSDGTINAIVSNTEREDM